MAPEYIISNQRLLLVGFHATVAIVMDICGIFCISRLLFPVVDMERFEFLKYHKKYGHWLLSIWLMVLQNIFVNIYFVIDIIDIFFKQNHGQLCNTLHKVGSYMLFAIVFPLSWMVSFSFWGIYILRRELIFPECMDEAFTPMFNHLAHTVPPFLSVLYMIFSNRNEPPKSQTLPGLLALLGVYVAAMTFIKLRDGNWPYYLLETLTVNQVIIYVALLVVSAAYFLFLGYDINHKIKGGIWRSLLSNTKMMSGGVYYNRLWEVTNP